MSTASNNSIERLIAQANSARSAGVFEATQVDVSSLVGSSPVAAPTALRLIRFYERALVGLPVAACLGIVVGIASMMGGPSGQSGSMFAGSDLAMNGHGAVNSHGYNDVLLSGGSVELCSFESVSRCFAGPGEGVSSDCGCADLDSDGDVDLVDLGSYQQRFALAQQ